MLLTASGVPAMTTKDFFLVKKFVLSFSVVALAAILFSPPATADYWQISYSCNGTTTSIKNYGAQPIVSPWYNTQTWNTNQVFLLGLDNPSAISGTGIAKVDFVWVPSSNDPSMDPPPQKSLSKRLLPQAGTRILTSIIHSLALPMMD